MSDPEPEIVTDMTDPPEDEGYVSPEVAAVMRGEENVVFRMDLEPAEES